VAEVACGSLGRRLAEFWTDCTRNDDGGLASFELLRGRRHDRVVALCAFDLLELDGRDLCRTPLEERKRALERLIGKARAGIVLNITMA
jgi:ATP-dependent DNA ligase